jgi:hypothetical protein
VGLAGRAGAIEVAWQRLFFGEPWRSEIEDGKRHRGSHVRVEASYWDIYHERRGRSLHDYDQDSQSVSGTLIRGRWKLGTRLRRSYLDVDQENLYTDSDHLTGEGERLAGSILLGRTFTGGAYPMGASRIETVAAAGWSEGFDGSAEVEVSWRSRAAVLVTGETFASRIETAQTINGYRFPFHFPFRTERWHARADVVPTSEWGLRAWTTYEVSRGRGDEVKGFENRLYFRRWGAGGSVSVALEPPRHSDIVPRPSREVSRLPGVRLSAGYNDGSADLGMRFNGIRYLHLDDVRIDNKTARLDVMARPWLGAFGGWERLSVAHDGRSFADIWPFTIWDVFTSRRYRLGHLDGRLDVLYAGLEGRASLGRTEFEWSGRFEWWEDDIGLAWFERIDLFYPILFTFERHDEAPRLRPTHAVHLDASTAIKLRGNLELSVRGRATAPFGDSRDKEPGPSGGGGGGGAGVPSTAGRDSTHGGLSGTIALTYLF